MLPRPTPEFFALFDEGRAACEAALELHGAPARKSLQPIVDSQLDHIATALAETGPRRTYRSADLSIEWDLQPESLSLEFAGRRYFRAASREQLEGAFTITYGNGWACETPDAPAYARKTDSLKAVAAVSDDSRTQVIEYSYGDPFAFGYICAPGFRLGDPPCEEGAAFEPNLFDGLAAEIEYLGILPESLERLLRAEAPACTECDEQ